ncbi:MAG TPA: PD-(D/E)XK nuclease family protein [Candidatus Methanoperedens sp.]|nr:PD-(D/E)XK nuclease family protein [Candidatus Methanoperedens sp.]
MRGGPLVDILHFLLVPDKASGRKVRRALASGGARCGVVVGTSGELVDQANRAYLPAPTETDWDARLGEAARKLPDAFWSESLKADPEGTLATVGWELRKLLEALGPGKDLKPAGKSSLSDRGKHHLADLSRLHEAMGRVLPDDLATIRALLRTDKVDATRLVVVYRKDGFPVLSPWQEVLVSKLASDAGSDCLPDLEAVLSGCLASSPAGMGKSALRHLQENLFVHARSQVPLDDTVTCLAVRDRLEAAEVAAGIVQRALVADPNLKTSDIGLLMPGDCSCDDAVREVFARAGLPVSGLEGPTRLRNIGGEAVFHFLVTRRKPAPAMALAALYATPVMPWDEPTGNLLAMEIMDGEYNPDPPEGLTPEGRRMMELIRVKHETPKALGEAIKVFGTLLNTSDGVAKHVEAARSALEAIVEALGKVKGTDVPWEELTSLVPQAPVPADAGTGMTREGIAIFREDEEPWRQVRLLCVAGFSEGRYPAGPGRSPVFDPADTISLKGDLGFAVETEDEGMARRRELLLRQLRVAGDRVVFLSPSRDAMGDPLAFSGTSAFMARLFKGIQAPEDLFFTLERESHRAKVKGLALAPPAGPDLSRVLEIRDPDLKCDLLTDGGGKLRPLTPSGLETMMVSPLAWFLDRMRISPLSWAPEELDPAMKGTLAHAVFETLFVPGTPLPAAAKISSSVEKTLSDAILRLAPFLTGTEWYVERRNLLKDIETAALRWREFLDRSGSEILGVETSLTGVFEGIPIRGRTDLLLSLPSGHIFVVDYKKSTSSTRRKCMEEGYDIQTSLYRTMLRFGSVVDSGGEELAKALKAGAEIGVLYYMMDDQRALTDTSGWISRTVSGVQELGDGISVNGENLVRERILALRAGKLPLNREDDAETFRKVGVKTYALEATPLISRFTHPVSDEEEGE